MALCDFGSLRTTSVMITPVSAARLEAVVGLESCPVATSIFEMVGIPYVLNRAKKIEIEKVL